MSRGTLPIDLRFDPETGLPLAPTRDVWATLTTAEQDRVIEALNAALGEYELTLPPEGTPHGEAQRDALDRIRRSFDRTRRGVFLATNLGIQYPGERPFAPDLIAVLDVPLHHRNAWVVEREGRGLDFALEVLFAGDEKKDLQRNVAWFCRLGIPEYFVFDGNRHRIFGWRLADDGTPRYVPIIPQAGRYASVVLGVELAVVDGALKLFRDGNPILATSEENALLVRMLDETHAALGAEAERARREEERARHEEERARHEEERAAAALAALRVTLRSVLVSRGRTLAAPAEARVDACDDPQRLAAWIAGALRAEPGGAFDLD
jgi:Uma2 family endonuclease